MASTNDVRPGMTLDLSDGLWEITEHQHVKPGKGKAFVRMKLKSLQGGATVERTFRADEHVSVAYISHQEYQYLYRDDVGYHFMDLKSYGQLTVPAEKIEAVADYLTDGMQVGLALYQSQPIGVDLPASVELKVTHSEPAVKGDRVSGATKPVTTETGLVVQVPLFVGEGDVIKVDTRTGDYVTRA